MTGIEKAKFKECLELVEGDNEKATHLYLQWKCLTDLYFLGTEIFGWKNAREGKRTRVDPVFHKWMATAMSTDDHILMLVARLHLKTTWMKAMVVQYILKNPDVRIGIFSVSARLVEQELTHIKQLFATPLLRRLFPDIIPDPGKDYSGWAKCTSNTLTLSIEGRTKQGDQIIVLGSGSHVAGLHVDIAILDDIIDDQSVHTAEMMRKTENWWAYINSVVEITGIIKIFGTRYHYNDIYGKIMKEKHIKAKNIFIRPATENGKVVYASWFTKEDLDRLRKRQGAYIASCNPGYAPVWMADLSFKPIEKIKPGDEVVGYETRIDRGERRRLVKSKVLKIGSRIAETVKVKMESGRELICTPDHQWFTGRYESDTHKTYLPAKVGRALFHFADPVMGKDYTFEQRLDYAWLAGIIDGEGAVRHGAIMIAQSETKNPAVCKKIIEVLNRLGLEYRNYLDRPGLKNCAQYVLQGGKVPKLKVLNIGKPAKADQIRENIWKWSGMKTNLKDKVVSIELYKTERVYSMQTETGNYVIWGYASKNCQYDLNPMPTEVQMFPPPQPTFSTLPDQKYNWYIAIDPAATTEAYSDKTGFVVAAVSEVGRVYIVEASALSMKGNELADYLIKKCVYYKPIKVGIEFGLQENLKYVIESKKSDFERAQGIQVPINIMPIPISRKMSKGTRINLTLGAFIRDGKLLIKDTCVELDRQMTLFTGMGNEEDDVVDAASMIFSVVEQFAYQYWFVPEGFARREQTFMDLFKKKEDYSWRGAFVT